ncbi:MAG: riboflavin synthase [Candidatus Schekmanbacteria bacterium]|nr:riboflavin synthase [Candidatus Schekmanbacteria bacterium]
MFTGIVEEIGTLRCRREQGRSCTLDLAASAACAGTRVGDSIAVHGVCLTATAVRADGFSADVSQETLRRTTAGQWRVGSRLHLERALALGGRVGGHLVQGHVDSTAAVTRYDQAASGAELWIRVPDDLLPYVIHKGSIALDGVSLTVAELRDPLVMIALVPHTLDRTMLGSVRPGARLNIEVDVIGKYVQRQLALGTFARVGSGPATVDEMTIADML